MVEAHSTAMQCQHCHEAGSTGLHGTSSREFPDLTKISLLRFLIRWDPLIRSSLTVNPPYKKAKILVPLKVFFVMTYKSSDIRISLIRNPPYKNVNFWSHRGR